MVVPSAFRLAEVHQPPTEETSTGSTTVRTGMPSHHHIMIEIVIA